ncbi:hypothetical protein Rsl_1373 [Rickettsia slovaca 13-B]|uniref:Uncharacterized protein n=1 Tax=Rickettsia slovaca (strain 13-B) TaxID=941638 RepID=A0ABM5MRU9_RICS1|nr:hypothetical protein Rsl_1373 [Rickettsia slovaca 13-B]
MPSAKCERLILRLDFDVFFFGTAIISLSKYKLKSICQISEAVYYNLVIKSR